MVGTLKYSCTALMGTQKKGELKPDADGYYYVCLGAFNYYNSAGIWYDWEGTKALFEASSTFQRRVKDGCVHAEVDHPEWLSTMTFDDYVRRIRKIDMANTCAHIREVEVKAEDFGSDGKQHMVVYGWVKPEENSERGKKLKDLLDNPHANVCFSIRSLCEDTFINGKVFRILTEIVNFDWVTEPGINKAKKWNSPALESMDTDIEIPMSIIKSVVAKSDMMARMGLESADDCNALREYIKRSETKTVVMGKMSGLTWED